MSVKRRGAARSFLRRGAPGLLSRYSRSEREDSLPAQAQNPVRSDAGTVHILMGGSNRLHPEALAGERPVRQAEVDSNRKIHAVATEGERQVVRHA